MTTITRRIVVCADMDRLSGVDELLDGPLDDRSALTGNLHDLAWFNRRLGGARLSAAAIDALAPGRAPIAVLDVGTGGADIPLALIERGRATGRLVRVTGIDTRPEVLAAAAVVDPRITATGELALHVGDARSLPFADDAFDVVHASMLVHHLEPAVGAGPCSPRWPASPGWASCSTTSSADGALGWAPGC